MDEYDASSIRILVPPGSVEFGDLWCRTWRFEVPEQPSRPLKLVPFVRPFPGRAMLVLLNWETGNELTLTVSTDSPGLLADEVHYVAAFGAYLKWRFPDGAVQLEGLQDHPMLHLARLTPAMIEVVVQVDG